MIRFLTLLLGLVIGPWAVTVDPGPGVARVDLVLDGESVATVEGEPWQAVVDLGEELVPHHLVAIARDADGAEIGRAEQWINLAPVPLEVEVAVERDAEGRPVAARVLWQGTDDRPVEQVTLTLDGEPLLLDANHRAPLPRRAGPDDAVLQAEVMLAGGETAHAGRLLGGLQDGHSDVGLTAVPLRVSRPLPAGRRPLPWLRAGGRPAETFAVERPAERGGERADGRGGADLLVVVDRSALPELEELASHFRTGFASRHRPSQDRLGAVRVKSPLDSGIEPGDRVWYVTTEAERVRPATSGAGAATVWLFRRFGPFGADQGGLPSQLLRLDPPPADGPQRLADAVATVGRDAYGGARPRAVVAVVGPGFEDASQHQWEAVRGYLESLRVPLHVWYVEQARGARFEAELERTGRPVTRRAERLAAAERRLGPLTDVSSTGDLLRGTVALRKDVDRQQVVWIEGRFLPGDVTLFDPPRGVTLLGGAGR